MGSPNETIEERRRRGEEIIAALEARYPEAGIALRYESPFQLLIATILSAQCTDERVNQVTPALFALYPDAQAFIDAPMEDLERAIYSTGFYRNKAMSIKGACRVLVEEFGGELPRTMEELLRLPGVGRKTANVLLGHCFDTPGVVVDTHVKRISNLLGLSGSADPDMIERELAEIVTTEKWTLLSHLLATHGRAVCIARRPQCPECPIMLFCPSAVV